MANRFHRVKNGSGISEWLKLISGVPQGSILGPLLFNIFLNDLFFCIRETDVCNFADDNTLFTSGKVLSEVVSILQRETCNVLEWFKYNSMTANPAKFQTMFLGVKEEDLVDICVNDIILKPINSVKLLGVTIDHKLNFKSHVTSICKSASLKVKALLRIRPYIDLVSARRLCNAYILSTFNYCPLIWMNGCKSNNELINKVHQRALCAVNRDFHSSFKDLLSMEKSETIHKRNLKTLMIEVFKSLNRLNPEILWEVFLPKNIKYNLRSGNTLSLIPTKTRKYGLNSLCFRGSLLWNTLPASLKASISLSEFRSKIKSWEGDTCSCPICS